MYTLQKCHGYLSQAAHGYTMINYSIMEIKTNSKLAVCLFITNQPHLYLENQVGSLPCYISSLLNSHSSTCICSLLLFNSSSVQL